MLKLKGQNYLCFKDYNRMATKKQIKNENRMLIVQPNQDVKKSNVLIESKYKSTLLENKLMIVSLSKVNELVKEVVEINGEPTTVLTSYMYANELCTLLGVDRSNLSKSLKSAYPKMASRQIGMEDEHGNFVYRSLFIGSDYVNGIFKLYYNPLLGSYYKQVEKNYTLLSLETMLKFKSVYSFRLYELLKKDCFIPKSQMVDDDVEGSIYQIYYSVAQLKLILGVIDVNEPAVRRLIDSHETDYDKIVAASKSQGFVVWEDFKKLIVKAIKEINETTELHVDFTIEKGGQGNKVHGINFMVTVMNDALPKEPPKTELSELEKMDFIVKLSTMLSKYSLSTADMMAIAEAANWELNNCENALKCLQATPNVNNVVGFLIKALKDNWSEPVQANKQTKKTPFHNFQQRDYDFDELEKILLQR